MICADLRDLIEPLAAGDLTPDTTIAEHLAACASCAGALARAQELDRLLRTREAPATPVNFTAGVVERVRADRWRAEQALDLGFNVAVAVGVFFVLIGIWLLLNLSGMVEVARDVSAAFRDGLTLLVQQAAPAAPTFLGALALLMTALLVWWWADRTWGY